MTAPKANLDQANFVATLLTTWQAAGNPLGTDKFLQVQKVLDQLPDDLPLENLRNFISPLLAHDAQSQRDFYKIFEQTLAASHLQMEQHRRFVGRQRDNFFWHETGVQVSIFQKKMGQGWASLSIATRVFITVFAAPTLLVVLAWLLFFQKEKAPIGQSGQQEFTISANLLEKEKQEVCISADSSLGEIVLLERLSPEPHAVEVEEFFKLTSFCFQFRAVEKGREKVEFRACFSSQTCRQFSIIFRSDFYPTLPPKPSSTGGPLHIRVGPATAAPLSKPRPAGGTAAINLPSRSLDSTNFGQIAPSQLTRQPSEFETEMTSGWRFGAGGAFFSIKKAAFAVAVAALLLALGWWLRRRNQKLTLRQQSDRQSPDTWTVRIPTAENVSMGDRFYLAVAEMRRRSETETRRFDLRATVGATVRRGGMIDFQFKNQFRGKNYLVLLDLAGADNLRARLFRFVVRQLQENEVPLEIFYFDDGDPRSCHNEKYPLGLPLADLQHRFGEHQLIVWGDAHALLELADGGKFADWAAVFDRWKRRALLTPRAASDWDFRENLLSKKFRVLPASPDGLAALVENLEAVEPKNHLLWRDQLADEWLETLVFPQTMRPDQLLAILEREFVVEKNGQRDDRLLRWIAALALPSVVFWDWLLHVGQRLAEPGEPFLSLKNLYKITRLGWLADGRLPESVRSTLIAWLEREHSQLDIRLRHEWQRVLNLEQNLPPVGSLAWQKHRVQVVLNELLGKPNWLRRRRLESELDRILPSQNHDDALLIQYLDRRRTALDRLLPDRFRKFLQKKQGIGWRWRDWTWQVGGTAICLIFSLFARFDEPVRIFKFEELPITGLDFTVGDSTFLVADLDGSISICHADGRMLLSSQKQELPKILDSRFDAAGNTLAVATADGTVKTWDIGGAPLQSWQKRRDSTHLNCLRFSPDLDKMLLGFYGGGIELWDVPRRLMLKKVEKNVAGHRGAVEQIEFSPDGKTAISCGRDGRVLLWDLRSGAVLRAFEGHENRVLCCAFSPDGQVAASADWSGQVRVWEVASGRQLASWQAHRAEVSAIIFAADGQSFFTGSFDKTVRRWSLAGELQRVFETKGERINALAVSSDGKKLLTGGADGRVRLWFLKK